MYNQAGLWSWCLFQTLIPFLLPMLHTAFTYTHPCSPTSVVEPPRPKICQRVAKITERRKAERWDCKRAKTESLYALNHWLNHVNVFLLFFLFWNSFFLLHTNEILYGYITASFWIFVVFLFFFFYPADCFKERSNSTWGEKWGEEEEEGVADSAWYVSRL